jgi:hypothetical protein
MPIIKDEFGIQLKYPDRDCKLCKRYPCMQNFSIFKCNFAKYGCKDYMVKVIDNLNTTDNVENILKE